MVPQVVTPLRLTSALLLCIAAGCTGTAETTPPADAGPRPDGGLPGDGSAEDDAALPTDAGPACLGGELDTSALVFDGVDDYVTMGEAPSLALAELTVEAWVRREGRGREAGTGVGGLRLVPIVAKGRGERDGTNVDCNYAFGFFGDVLGADFEDMASGANHPVVGVTAVPYGEWHHVAASFDGTAWRLYVDGRLDAEQTVSATPRADSIQHFGIGTMLNSTGVAVGALHGAVDEVRVWDHARTEAQIAAAMHMTAAPAPGLVGRWALDASDMGAPDSAGDSPGTIEGAMFDEPGAVLGRGSAPTATPRGPLDGDTVTGPSVELAVDVADPDSDAFAVTFHARELTAEDDFTVVVLPDTQYYTVEGSGREHWFYEQTQWIMDNRLAYDVVAVIHNGDLVQRGDRLYEWRVADRAMTTLESIEDDLKDGLPYGVAVGNHDQQPIGTTGSTANYNTYFGVDRFADRVYYGGHYGRRNDEHWFTFQAGGLDFVVVSLQFDTTQDPAVIAWARRVFQSHSGAFGILNSHYLTGRTAAFGPQGQAIYDGLRDVDNLQLMTCGHVPGESVRTDTFEGNDVHTMLADYQGRDDGGSGWLRIWELSPASNELTVRTYSPGLDEWETDEGSEFTLPVDLAGAGGPFTDVGVVERAGEASSVAFDVEPGRIYEWYATVSDCYHTVRTPVQRFTTSP